MTVSHNPFTPSPVPSPLPPIRFRRERVLVSLASPCVCLCMNILFVLSCSLVVSSRWTPWHSSGTLCRHEFTWFCYTEHATQFPLINSLLPLLSICVCSVCSESSSLVRLRYMFCHSSVTLCRHDSTWVCCTVHAPHCLRTAGLFPLYRAMYVYPVSSASFPSGQFEIYVFCLFFIFAFRPGYLKLFLSCFP